MLCIILGGRVVIAGVDSAIRSKCPGRTARQEGGTGQRGNVSCLCDGTSCVRVRWEQLKHARVFISKNKQAFFNMGLGTVACLLSMRVVKKEVSVAFSVLGMQRLLASA